MRIILSPAKKMRTDDGLPWQDLPVFIDRTQRLMEAMQGMDAAQRQALWKCNDQIARLNTARLADMDLRKNLTPAILSYDGIAYQRMAPGVFTSQEMDYVQEHLRILSGFYGILRPLDGVTPYRLEMQAKLEAPGAKDLYTFWGDSLARELCRETDCIINLASREYSAAVAKFLPDSVRFITCVFGELKGGKVVEKATMCKMARGETVRFLAQNRITDPEEVKAFRQLNFRFSPEYSNCTTFTFLH